MKELTFAFHALVHDFICKSSDCTLKRISNLFDSKFDPARTKTEGLIVNIIETFDAKSTKKQINDAHFLSVTMDCTNRKKLILATV